MRSPDRVVASRSSTRGQVMLVAALIVGAVAAAYYNSLDAPFVFDDPLAIVENPTIRKLWPLTDVLLPPRGEGQTVEGRPVLNLTLALNYAIGGTSVRGYHVVNVIVHALAALALLGVVRRALLLPRLRERFGVAAALPLAAIVALLWALHPLQTESVTYVVQRAEALMGLFYLLTFYCFLRGVEITAPSITRTTWFLLAFLACLMGMATKEVAVSAPLMVLLFDRAFVAGSFREAWRRRAMIHGALFATWLLLAALVIRTGTRGGTAGFGINVMPWEYALTQFEAVTRYIWMSFWPQPLIFDYGVAWVKSASDVLPYAVVLFALMGGTVVAWWRWPAAAFLGILFFAVLSPTSSIVPGNRQTIAEHRMYLPLAAVILCSVSATYLAVRGAAAARRGIFAAGVALAVACGVLTMRRNEDYRSVLALYRDTAVKRPGNGFARYNLGKACADAGRHVDAASEYEAALRLIPGVPHVHLNFANSLAALGRIGDARAHYESALRLDPNYANAHFNLGNLLLRVGDKEAARQHFETAVRLAPEQVDARTNLGSVLLELGRLGEAREEFERVLHARPESVEAHFGLGNMFLLQERWADAAREFEAVVKSRPDLAIARERLELARSRARF